MQFKINVVQGYAAYSLSILAELTGIKLCICLHEIARRNKVQKKQTGKNGECELVASCHTFDITTKSNSITIICFDRTWIKTIWSSF